MADEEKQAEVTEESSESSGGGGLKMILIIAVIMIVEGAGLYVILSKMGGPKAIEASELAGLEDSGEEAPVEVELLKERFQNMQTGRVWEWRVEIFLRVRTKNLAEITRLQERDAATLKEGVALIFRRAHDRHLREPDLATITRQVTTYLNEQFGVDPDGIPFIDRVIIPECKGFPADG